MTLDDLVGAGMLDGSQAAKYSNEDSKHLSIWDVCELFKREDFRTRDDEKAQQDATEKPKSVRMRGSRLTMKEKMLAAGWFKGNQGGHLNPEVDDCSDGQSSEASNHEGDLPSSIVQQP